MNTDAPIPGPVHERFSWRHLFFIAWVIFIIGAYYVHHPLHLGCPGASLSSCTSYWTEPNTVLFHIGAIIKGVLFIAVSPKAFVFYGFLALYALLGFRKHRAGTSFSLRLSALTAWMSVWLLLYVTITLFILVFSLQTGTDFAWLEVLLSVFEKLGIVALALTILGIIVLIIGDRLIRILPFTFEQESHRAILAAGFGLIIYSYCLMVLGSLRLLTPYAVIISTVVILLLCYKSIGTVIGSLVKQRSLVWRPFSLEALAWGIALAAVAINLTDLLQPMPTGWDAVYRYINTPRLLAQHGGLIAGVNAYPLELIMALGTVVWNSIPVTQSIAAGMGFLGVIGLYILLKAFVSRPLASIVAVLYFVNTVVLYQSSMEVKIDPPLFFFAVLSFISFWYLVRAIRSPAHWYRWAALTGLLIGFCFAVKYTSMLLMISVGCTIAVLLMRTPRKKLREIFATLALFFCFAGLPFLPWLVKNIVDARGVVSIDTIQRGDNPGPTPFCSFDAVSAPATTAPVQETADPAIVSAEEIPLDDTSAEPVNIEISSLPAEPTGTEEELGRYWGYQRTGSIVPYVLLPWTVTMNTTVNVLAAHISFAYLALLVPLILLFPLRHRTDLMSFGLCTAVYWVLWAATGKGVIWYGLPGFAGLSIVLACLLYARSTDKVVWRTGIGTVCFSLVALLYVRMIFVTVPAQYEYLAGKKPAVHFIDYAYPGYRQVAEIINSRLPRQGGHNFVYRIGTYIPFFVEKNDERIYHDDQLDMFTCLMRKSDFDPELLLSDLKQKGFRFIVLTPDIAAIDTTPEQTLKGKAEAMADIINEAHEEKLVNVLVNATRQQNKIILLEIP